MLAIASLGSALELAITAVMVIVGVGCVILTALRLPGTWVIVGLAAGYGWLTDWKVIDWRIMLVLGGAAVIAELVELVASLVTAGHAGATRRASWGGLIGGFLGMAFLSFLVPIPLVGTVIGALVGCFAGAMLMELSAGRKLNQGTRVGLFSALGFALGTAAKTAIAVAMCGIVLTTAVCRDPQADGPPSLEDQANPAVIPQKSPES